LQVTVDIRSPISGKIEELFAATGDEVEVGKPLFAITEGAVGAPAKASTPAASTAPAKAAAAPAAETKKAAPVESAPAAPKKAAPAASTPAPSTSTPIKGDRSETRVKMSRMRLRISDRLKESQNTAAMLTTFQEVDMTNLIEMRNEHKDEFEKVHNVKLGFMSAFVKVRSYYYLQ
jgi:2-oxoglutarate dehydrogenase E2 component (dihydrolipoamide succinyltransferase)